MSITEFARRTHMERSRAESLVFIVAGTLIALATLFAVSWVAGFGHVLDRLRDVNPIWFLVAFGAEAVAYVGYVLSYREVARVDEGPEMAPRAALAAVTAGFGAFVAQGGFSVDLHAFRQEFVDDREARVRVLGLGALEYALLAPATCIVAILLLLGHVQQHEVVHFALRQLFFVGVQIVGPADDVAGHRLQPPHRRMRQQLGRQLDAVGELGERELRMQADRGLAHGQVRR